MKNRFIIKQIVLFLIFLLLFINTIFAMEASDLSIIEEFNTRSGLPMGDITGLLLECLLLCF